MHITITGREYQELMRAKRDYEKLIKIINNLCEFHNKMQDDINTYNICVDRYDLRTLKHFFNDFKNAFIKDIEPRKI